jgi:polyisoprenyl-phosphate glycosyltransferase
MASTPPSHDQTAAGAIGILIPVFNDWTALGELLHALDRSLAGHHLRATVYVVDDGSTIDPGPDFPRQELPSLERIEVLALRRNLGHQRAIAIGLAYVEGQQGRCQTLVVMDGDGEDDPDDVPRLLEQVRREGGEKIVFAERARRSESWSFRLFYAAYRAVHLALIGTSVRVGNFSAIPRGRLESLVVVSELWNHYAAAAFKSRQPSVSIRTERAKRLHGRSQMNFINLVIHGLSALSVYSEIVGVRLLVASLAMIFLSLLGIVTTVAVRATTDWAIPGWATYTAGILLVVLLQAVMLATLFSFITLSARNGLTFLPLRDYSYFIAHVRVLGQGREDNEAPPPRPAPSRRPDLAPRTSDPGPSNTATQ